jgi:hypothetical protein
VPLDRLFAAIKRDQPDVVKRAEAHCGSPLRLTPDQPQARFQYGVPPFPFIAYRWQLTFTDERCVVACHAGGLSDLRHHHFVL